MILADKIIEERKRNGWSQEELAERLQVSRQSVSKWEGAQSIPDINRIIQMAELFGVSTDYLLKDDVTRDAGAMVLSESVDSDRRIRTVSMEEASEFLALKKRHAPLVGLAVSMCVLSPVLLIVLSGLSGAGMFGITENLAGGIGMLTLLSLVAAAVYTFIKCGNEAKKYEFLDTDEIDTAYGVDGMAKEKRSAFEGTFNRYIGIGVMLCVLCSVPLLMASFLTEQGYVATCMVGVLLVMVAAAVNLFVRAGMVKESYDKLLQEGDYTVEKKAQAPFMNRIANIYWLSAVAIYLAVSLPTGRWDITWILWPIAGIMYAVVVTIVKMVIKAKD